MSTKTKGSEGFPLTSLGWLTAHHKTKLNERKMMVEAHQISKGDHILDIACGPGFWTDLLLNAVGPSGTIIGLDIDPELIQFAQNEYRDPIVKGRVKFLVGDMRELNFKNNSFDAVICGNAYNYVQPEELPLVIAEHMRVLKLGGRLSIRAFDNTISIFHPVPSSLLLSIMHGAAEALSRTQTFDNYLGKKLHGLLASQSLGEVRTQTFVTQKVQPLSLENRDYISMKANWYAEQAKGFCPSNELSSWLSLFDAKSDNFILDRPDFYFSTIEMISSLVKPEISR